MANLSRICLAVLLLLLITIADTGKGGKGGGKKKTKGQATQENRNRNTDGPPPPEAPLPPVVDPDPNAQPLRLEDRPRTRDYDRLLSPDPADNSGSTPDSAILGASDEDTEEESTSRVTIHQSKGTAEHGRVMVSAVEGKKEDSRNKKGGKERTGSVVAQSSSGKGPTKGNAGPGSAQSGSNATQNRVPRDSRQPKKQPKGPPTTASGPQKSSLLDEITADLDKLHQPKRKGTLKAPDTQLPPPSSPTNQTKRTRSLTREAEAEAERQSHMRRGESPNHSRTRNSSFARTPLQHMSTQPFLAPTVSGTAQSMDTRTVTSVAAVTPTQGGIPVITLRTTPPQAVSPDPGRSNLGTGGTILTQREIENQRADDYVQRMLRTIRTLEETYRHDMTMQQITELARAIVVPPFSACQPPPPPPENQTRGDLSVTQGMDGQAQRAPVLSQTIPLTSTSSQPQPYDGGMSFHAPQVNMFGNVIPPVMQTPLQPLMATTRAVFRAPQIRMPQQAGQGSRMQLRISSPPVSVTVGRNAGQADRGTTPQVRTVEEGRRMVQSYVPQTAASNAGLSSGISVPPVHAPTQVQSSFNSSASSQPQAGGVFRSLYAALLDRPPLNDFQVHQLVVSHEEQVELHRVEPTLRLSVQLSADVGVLRNYWLNQIQSHGIPSARATLDYFRDRLSADALASSEDMLCLSVVETRGGFIAAVRYRGGTDPYHVLYGNIMPTENLAFSSLVLRVMGRSINTIERIKMLDEENTESRYDFKRLHRFAGMSWQPYMLLSDDLVRALGLPRIPAGLFVIRNAELSTQQMTSRQSNWAYETRRAREALGLDTPTPRPVANQGGSSGDDRADDRKSGKFFSSCQSSSAKRSSDSKVNSTGLQGDRRPGRGRGFEPERSAIVDTTPPSRGRGRGSPRPSTPQWLVQKGQDTPRSGTSTASTQPKTMHGRSDSEFEDDIMVGESAAEKAGMDTEKSADPDSEGEIDTEIDPAWNDVMSTTSVRSLERREAFRRQRFQGEERRLSYNMTPCMTNRCSSPEPGRNPRTANSSFAALNTLQITPSGIAVPRDQMADANIEWEEDLRAGSVARELEQAAEFWREFDLLWSYDNMVEGLTDGHRRGKVAALQSNTHAKDLFSDFGMATLDEAIGNTFYRGLIPQFPHRLFSALSRLFLDNTLSQWPQTYEQLSHDDPYMRRWWEDSRFLIRSVRTTTSRGVLEAVLYIAYNEMARRAWQLGRHNLMNPNWVARTSESRQLRQFLQQPLTRPCPVHELPGPLSFNRLSEIMLENSERGRHIIYHLLTGTRWGLPADTDGSVMEDMVFIIGPPLIQFGPARNTDHRMNARIPIVEHALSFFNDHRPFVVDGEVWSGPLYRYMWMYFSWVGLTGPTQLIRNFARQASIAVRGDSRPFVNQVFGFYAQLRRMMWEVGIHGDHGWFTTLNADDVIPPQRSLGRAALFSTLVHWLQQHPFLAAQGCIHDDRFVAHDGLREFGISTREYGELFRFAVRTALMNRGPLMDGFIRLVQELPRPSIRPQLTFEWDTPDQLVNALREWVPYLEKVPMYQKKGAPSQWPRRRERRKLHQEIDILTNDIDTYQDSMRRNNQCVRNHYPAQPRQAPIGHVPPTTRRERDLRNSLDELRSDPPPGQGHLHQIVRRYGMEDFRSQPSRGNSASSAKSNGTSTLPVLPDVDLSRRLDNVLPLPGNEPDDYQVIDGRVQAAAVQEDMEQMFEYRARLAQEQEDLEQAEDQACSTVTVGSAATSQLPTLSSSAERLVADNRSWDGVVPVTRIRDEMQVEQAAEDQRHVATDSSGLPETVTVSKKGTEEDMDMDATRAACLREKAKLQRKLDELNRQIERSQCQEQELGHSSRSGSAHGGTAQSRISEHRSQSRTSEYRSRSRVSSRSSWRSATREDHSRTSSRADPEEGRRPDPASSDSTSARSRSRGRKRSRDERGSKEPSQGDAKRQPDKK